MWSHAILLYRHSRKSAELLKRNITERPGSSSFKEKIRSRSIFGEVEDTEIDKVEIDQRSQDWCSWTSPRLTVIVKTNTAYQGHRGASAKEIPAKKTIALLCVVDVGTAEMYLIRRDFVTAKKVLMTSLVAAKFALMLWLRTLVCNVETSPSYAEVSMHCPFRLVLIKNALIRSSQNTI